MSKEYNEKDSLFPSFQESALIVAICNKKASPFGEAFNEGFRYFMRFSVIPDAAKYLAQAFLLLVKRVV
jgi:hypothetical protein